MQRPCSKNGFGMGEKQKKVVWPEQGGQLGEYPGIRTDAPQMQDLFLVLSPPPHPHPHPALPQRRELASKLPGGRPPSWESWPGWIPNLRTVHKPVLPTLCVSYSCPPACPVCPTGPHQVLQTLAFSGLPRSAAWPRPGSGLCPAFLSPLETLSQFIQLLRNLTEHLWCARQCPGKTDVKKTDRHPQFTGGTLQWERLTGKKMEKQSTLASDGDEHHGEKRSRGRNGECRGWGWSVGAGEGRGIPGSPLLVGQEAYQSHFVAIRSLPWYVHQA